MDFVWLHAHPTSTLYPMGLVVASPLVQPALLPLPLSAQAVLTRPCSFTMEHALQLVLLILFEVLISAQNAEETAFNA